MTVDHCDWLLPSKLMDEREVNYDIAHKSKTTAKKLH